MNGPLLDPSFWSLYCKESDHGSCAVVVVEGLDVPGSSLHDGSHGSFKTKDEKFTPEKEQDRLRSVLETMQGDLLLCRVTKILLDIRDESQV